MSLVKLRGVRRMITVEILDALYLNGEQLSGVFKTSSDGLYAIDSEVLKELIAKSKRCLELEKSSSHMMSMLKSGKLASNEKEKPDKTPGEILGELSAKARIAKKQQAVAVALSLSMRGCYPYKIMQALEKRGLGCSSATVSRALSVLKDGDRERLLDAFRAFPEEFAGFTEQDFINWFDARYADAKKAEDKKETNKRIRELVSEWGE